MESEPNSRPTLQHIRLLFPFDVATLAAEAGVQTDTLYYALQQHPITRPDAERILRATSRHVGIELSLHTVEVVTWEEYEFLWLVRASKPPALQQLEQAGDHYTLLYARNREHASALTHSWLQSLPDYPYHSFTQCVDGLQVDDIVVPGYQHRLEMERRG